MIAGFAPIVALALTLMGASAVSAASRTSHAGGGAPVGAGPASAPRPYRLPAGDRMACPAAAVPAYAECTAVLRAVAATASSSVPGYSPASLRSAYNLTKVPATAGHGETVAIVEAYGDPHAAADLAVYRSHYKLPACSRVSGCLRIVNEHGSVGSLPKADPAWASVQSIGLDVISALCPRCHLLLIQATSNSLTDLGTAEDTAVSAGARFVFNGWGGLDSLDENSYAHYFNHPGVAIVFSTGTSGYGTSFPADLPYVTAVGGTTLTRSKFNARHWAEAAWSGSGSGCSILQTKPSWQRADENAATGCLNRTQNDVAADADPSTGAAIYDSYGTTQNWSEDGGTALAAAIMTAVYALAGTPAPHTYPASYPYQHASHLYDVLFGSDGTCGIARQYLCTAGKGYDGPTGLGTPDGTAAFSAPADQVTVIDPGVQDEEAGTAVSVKVSGLDARGGATSLRYSAHGLPSGLSIRSSPHSTSAEIAGKLPGAVASYKVTVTAKDTRTRKTASTQFSIVAAASLRSAHLVTTELVLGGDLSVPPASGACLDAGAGTAGTIVTVQNCTGTQEQLWTYTPGGAPSRPATVTADGLCLDNSIRLAKCASGAASQGWLFKFGGELENQATGTCLDGYGYTNPLSLVTCTTQDNNDEWTMFAVILKSAVSATSDLCLAVFDIGSGSAPAELQTCPAAPGFSMDIDGSFETSLDRCIGEGGPTGVGSGSCPSFYPKNPADVWLPGPGGELINEAAGLCLDDPGNSTTVGTDLVLSPCYRQLGEIWSIN